MSSVGIVRYRHLGVTTDDGVELMAEVALLSRSIKIRGEMEESCYADNLCDHFDYDTFGGHIQVGGIKSSQILFAQNTSYLNASSGKSS